MSLYQLGSQDAQFLFAQTPSNLTHTTTVCIYDPSTAPDGKVRFKDIIEHVRSRLNISPIFRRKLFRLPLDLDLPYWIEDTSFDLEAHIAHTRLPEPGDWRQLCIFIARHHSRPMDMSRPLWDAMVVEGLDNIEGYPKGAFALVVRLHHCAMDGGSAIPFFTALNDIDANGQAPVIVPADPPDHGREPTAAEIWNRAMTSNMTSPARLANSLARFAPALLDAAQKNVAGGHDNETPAGIPETRFNDEVTPHRVFEGCTFALDDLKAIKNKVPGATINDAVLAICGGAIRRYMQQHKELPDQPMIGWVPINSRKSGDDGSAGNRISAMTVALGTNIADPMKRLIAIFRETREAKAAKSGLSARIMTDLSQHIPGATLAAAARLLTSGQFKTIVANAFISNVPGPQMPLYMTGAQCIGMHGLAPLGNGMGLFIATPSYNGMISFSLTSDRKIMPDIEFFRECIHDSFNELLDAPAPKAEDIAPESEKRPAKKETVSAPKAAAPRKRVKEINP